MSEKTSREKTIASHYNEINRLGANGEYERALKAANRILGMAPQEFLAFHCKIVCLIHLSKFEEAINFINRNPQFAALIIFEKAYIYYRLNQHTEALNTLKQSKDVDYRLKELEAQILYRLESFEEAAKLYEEVIENVEDDYEDERKTNLTAALVHLDRESTVDIPESTYEICYNKACQLIAKGQYAEAEKKLKQCEKMCREMLEEDEASEEEIDIDLALIRVQLAFVYQKQGRIKEAHQLYSSNLKMKLEDIALIAVASNNVTCINKDQNLFDSKKKMKAALNSALVHKLPSQQRKYIALNNAILNYYLHQTDQCEKICNNIDSTWPELSLYTCVLRAVNLLKAEKPDDAIALLRKFKSKNSTDKLYINLCIVQIHLMYGEKKKACEVLENMGDDTYKPGIVGALTTLYLGLGDEDTALKVFEKTVDWYKRNKVKEVDLTNIWRQAAEFHIKNGHPQVAANSLEELLKTNKGDKKVTAQLVLALSQFDKARAVAVSNQLPSVKEIAKGIDIESLQVTAASQTVFTVKKTPSAAKQESQPSTPHTDGEVVKKKKHKKRKGKLPKNYNPNIPPDPERWLPRYERAGYRKKRDRRAKEVIKGSQGQASGSADQYDFSKHMEQDSQESPSSNVETPPVAKNKGYHQKKTQKKKGKRR